MTENYEESQIKEVWAHNVEEELLKIADLIVKFPYIAMDTEFPGCLVSREQMGAADPYIFVKGNVDVLNLIQLGITLSDAQGNMPTPINTW